MLVKKADGETPKENELSFSKTYHKIGANTSHTKTNNMFKGLVTFLNGLFGTSISEDAEAADIEKAVEGLPTLDSIKSDIENKVKGEYEDRIKSLEEKANAQVDPISEMKSQLATLAESVKGLTEKSEALNTQIETLTTEKAALAADKTALEAKLAEAKLKTEKSNAANPNGGEGSKGTFLTWRTSTPQK